MNSSPLVSRFLLAGLSLTAVVCVSGQDLPEQYREPFARSFPIREEQHLQIKDYADRLLADQAREAMQKVAPDFSSVAAYEASLAPYREHLRDHFGTPPPGAKEGRITRFEQVGEDAHSTIHRVWIEVIDGVEAYGLYMVPKRRLPKAPLVIAQHGGGGNPEAICDLDTREGYRRFGFEAVKRGYIVWAPALAMRCGFCEDPDIPGAQREQLDRKLKLAGTSIVGLELHKIIESTRTLMKVRPEIDAERVGMTGLSWGGFYTMYATALSPFIKVAAPSGYLKDHEQTLRRVAEGVARPPESEAFGGLGHFQAIALICPRPCLLQLGRTDTVVSFEDAQPEVRRAASFYEKLGLEDRFRFHAHDDGHVFDTGAILDFFDEHL